MPRLAFGNSPSSEKTTGTAGHYLSSGKVANRASGALPGPLSGPSRHAVVANSWDYWVSKGNDWLWTNTDTPELMGLLRWGGDPDLGARGGRGHDGPHGGCPAESEPGLSAVPGVGVRGGLR